MVESLSAIDSRSAGRSGPALQIVIGENNEDLAITLRLLLEAEPDMCCISLRTQEHPDQADGQ